MEKNKIYENLTDNIGLENFKKVEKRNMKIRNFVEKTFTFALCVLSISGMVFAKDISKTIYENIFQTGQGTAIAINEGYIEEKASKPSETKAVAENEETGKKVEDIDGKIKIENFMMDDFYLSMTFDIELSDKIRKIINPDNIGDMSLPDMIVYDENNNILISLGDENDFNEFCEAKQLEYNYNNIPEDKFYGSGMNWYISEKNKNHIKMICNLYLEGETAYPKSKKINVSINTIRISNDVESIYGEEEISIIGNWNLEFDVPEKMYNRETIMYKQISTTNKDFNIYSAILYNTGMEVKVGFPAIEESSEELIMPEKEFYDSLPADDELKSIEILNYIEGHYRKLPAYQEYAENKLKKWQVDSRYVTNENGEKFEPTQGPRANNSGTITEENIYVSTTMYDLTKYDATDRVTLHIEYNGKSADIVLEKVEE